MWGPGRRRTATRAGHSAVRCVELERGIREHGDGGKGISEQPEDLIYCHIEIQFVTCWDGIWKGAAECATSSMAGSSRLLCSPFPFSSSHFVPCVHSGRSHLNVSSPYRSLLRDVSPPHTVGTICLLPWRVPSLINLCSPRQCPTSLDDDGVLRFPAAAYIRRAPRHPFRGHDPGGELPLVT